jgi:hypothetical protein
VAATAKAQARGEEQVLRESHHLEHSERPYFAIQTNDFWPRNEHHQLREMQEKYEAVHAFFPTWTPMIDLSLLKVLHSRSLERAHDLPI